MSTPFSGTFCTGCGEEVIRSGEAYVHIRNNRTACPPSAEAELSRIRTLLDSDDFAEHVHDALWPHSWTKFRELTTQDRRIYYRAADKLRSYLLGSEEPTR